MTRRTERGGDHKLRQLAAQIGRSLDATLVGDCHDDVLNNISVDKVEPGPGNRMLVTLMVHPPGSGLEKAEVFARLEAHRRLLVERVAQDLNRRAVPELSFWLVRDPDAPVGSAQDDEDSADPPSVLDV